MDRGYKIIITADDFGYSREINRAIGQAVRELPVKSVSMLVNFPGFDDGLEALRAKHVVPESLGLHVNLTEGFPLTEGIKKYPLFCDPSGRFIYGRAKSLVRLAAPTRQAVYEELEMQMKRFVEGSGRVPDHLDSHHHVHTEWPVFRLVVRLAQRYGVARIRLARNTGIAPSRVKKNYRNLLNGFLRRFGGVAVTDYFGNIQDFLTMDREALTGKYLEVMIHPMYTEDRRLVDSDQQDLARRLREFQAIFHSGPQSS